MKRFRPTLVTLLVAHIAGSYCAGLFPLILERVLHHNHHALIFGTWSHVFAGLALAAIIPLFLVSETVGAFPHYYHSLPQYWACYTVPFVIVCLIRHKKSSVTRLAMAPVMATLFVIVTYQLLPERVSLGIAPVVDLTAMEQKPAPDFTLTTLSGTTCWADHWPKITSGPFAKGLNAAAKYVATHRPESLGWGPVRDLGTDIVEGIRGLKSSDGPDLIVWGSSTLSSMLLDRGLFDEVVLIVYPVLLGRGKRFFSDSADPRELALVSTKATSTGVLINTYRHVGSLQTG